MNKVLEDHYKRLLSEYREGMGNPVHWVVNEEEIRAYKKEMDTRGSYLEKQYASMIAPFEGNPDECERNKPLYLYYSGDYASHPIESYSKEEPEYDIYGTAPVKDSILGIIPPSTVLFKRYPTLSVAGHEALSKKYEKAYAVVENSCKINLKENMSCFNYLDDLKKQMEKSMKKIDVSQELKDLLKIYTDAEFQLKRKEETALSSSNYYSKIYLNSLDEREKMSDKLKELKKKIVIEEDKSCDCCDEGDDE